MEETSRQENKSGATLLRGFSFNSSSRMMTCANGRICHCYRASAAFCDLRCKGDPVPRDVSPMVADCASPCSSRVRMIAAKLDVVFRVVEHGFFCQHDGAGLALAETMFVALGTTLTGRSRQPRSERISESVFNAAKRKLELSAAKHVDEWRY